MALACDALIELVVWVDLGRLGGAFLSLVFRHSCIARHKTGHWLSAIERPPTR